MKHSIDTWIVFQKTKKTNKMTIEERADAYVGQKSSKPLTLTMLVLSYVTMYAHTTLTNAMLSAILGKCSEE